MNILLTNDDSHRSPLLRWAISTLQDYGSVTVVVPAHEQSWRGKAISRFQSVALEEIELHGVQAFALDGTPADCVNIALHHLCGVRPDLVVSGINAGLNAGACFMLSSGTVGACFEANIAGVPAVALSQAFDRETMNYYIAEYALPKTVEQHLAEQTPRLVTATLRALVSGKFLAPDTTWNVNFPFTAISDQPVLAKLGASSYGSCFRREDRQFVFDLTHVVPDCDAQSDAQLLRAGRVSITPLRASGLGAICAEDQKLTSLVERHPNTKTS